MTVAEDERPSWRARVRNGTIQEIRRSARTVLTTEGQSGLTIRAVAREMGLSSPSIYRYFSSHGELVGAVIVDLLDELVRHIEAALGEHGLAEPADGIQLAATALRAWALEHPHEFDLTMTTPVDLGAADSTVEDARWRFAAVFADLFSRLWQQGRFQPPPASGLHPGLVTAAERVRERMQLPLPVEAVAAFLRGWVRLYGVVCMEAMGQLRLIGDDSGAIFESELRELGSVLRH